MSGNTVAFLDPHEKYFVLGQPGQAFSMGDPLLAEHFDQFEPFHQIFDCNLNNQGNCYSGTLFRFPLRTEPSKLSTKIYTREMVNTLFDSFKNEASAILLFLKNVDSVSLYEREEQGEIFHLYTARVSEKSKTEVRKRRQELIQDITVEWDFAVKTTFYRLEIEKKCPEKPSEKKEWFLANQVGTNEMKLVELARDLKLLPWIGIAFPVDANNNMSLLGRIFCFLPLPPDGDCRTGLPVQVNGYFGLTDNRRALKWPGPDCQNDDTAQWNQLLLEKVGSQVYANLIVNMVRESSSNNFPPELLAKLVLIQRFACPHQCQTRLEMYPATVFQNSFRKRNILDNSQRRISMDQPWESHYRSLGRDQRHERRSKKSCPPYVAERRSANCFITGTRYTSC